MPSIVISLRITDELLAKALDGIDILGLPSPAYLNDIVRQTFLVGLAHMHNGDFTTESPSNESWERLITITMQKRTTTTDDIIKAMSKEILPMRYPKTLLDHLSPADQVIGIKILSSMNAGVSLFDELSIQDGTTDRITAEIFYPIKHEHSLEEASITTTYNKYNKEKS